MGLGRRFRIVSPSLKGDEGTKTRGPGVRKEKNDVIGSSLYSFGPPPSPENFVQNELKNVLTGKSQPVGEDRGKEGSFPRFQSFWMGTFRVTTHDTYLFPLGLSKEQEFLNVTRLVWLRVDVVSQLTRLTMLQPFASLVPRCLPPL